jgi:hypothetical protein
MVSFCKAISFWLSIKMRLAFNPDYAVDTYCGLKNLAVPPWRDFPILLLNIFMNMPSAQNRSNFSFR